MSILAKNLSMAGGELSPSLYARTDMVKYQQGLRTCRNMMVMRHGGVANRPGTKFIAEAYPTTAVTDGGIVRLIPFVFNDSQSYTLVFGDSEMRVIKNGAWVTMTAQNITGISAANPAVLTYAGADTYANGDHVKIAGLAGSLGDRLNGRVLMVANVNAGANTFELQDLHGNNIDGTALPAYTSGGTVAEVFALATPWTNTQIYAVKYAQSADVLTLTHPSLDPREIARVSDTNWTINTLTFAPSIAAPTNYAAGGAGTGTGRVTATSVIGEESLPSNTDEYGAGAQIHQWDDVVGALHYNLYVLQNGVYVYVKRVAQSEYTVDSATFVLDVARGVPVAGTPFTTSGTFNSANDRPSCCAYFQQRLLFGNTNNDPETVFGSFIGSYKNFRPSGLGLGSDPFSFVVAGLKVNRINHLLDMERLIIFTSGGEYMVEGNQDGIVTPAVNIRKISSYGSVAGDINSCAIPLDIGGNVLFVQARGGIVRSLQLIDAPGYRGTDLTVFSGHLFKGVTIQDWAYQQLPHSILWAVAITSGSDETAQGDFYGLTYLPEHQIWAWHRHDTSGSVENVCCIPEGNEDALYMVVNRSSSQYGTIRCIERMATRSLAEPGTTSLTPAIQDFIAMDSTISYDGWNTGATTMTLSGGTNWTYDEMLTLTASVAYFASTDVGNAIHLKDASGNLIRFTIVGFTSTTVVTGHPHMTVPSGLRSTARTTWAKAIKTVPGLWHLEGRTVSVFGDGNVVASPNNAAYTTVTVSNGQITLDQPYAKIHVGLPFISDIETLDIDTAEGEPLNDKKMLITNVTLRVEQSRGIFAGHKPPTDDDTDPLERLYELKIRNQEGYDEPNDLTTASVDILFGADWNSNGRVFIRQVDPVPLTILSISPSGMIPPRR